MSIEIIKSVWDHSQQSGTKRLVMIALADMANADGYCWPSIPRIAQMCKCTNRYIMKIVPDLEADGEVYVDHRPGRARGNVYMITLNVSVDNFAKRLIHYLDYGPTEALSIALTHLGKGEQESQIVNPSSPLPRKLKVNYSREKVNYSREKVNPSSPDPIEPIRTVIKSDQGVGSARAATPTPPPATPTNGVRKMGNDEYDHPLSQSAPPSPPVPATPSSGRPLSARVDGRKFKGGRIPAGTGANAVEVFYERHNINETKLSAPKEDDLIKAVTDLARWRDVVIAWHQSDYKPTNIKGQLDWYRDGIPERNGNAGSTTGFGLTAYAEKERKQYERDFGPDEELTPEKEQRIREYFERRPQDQGV